MITLWDTENLSIDEVEKKAYATADSCHVSVKQVRALARRALANAQELEHLHERIGELEEQLEDAKCELGE